MAGNRQLVVAIGTTAVVTAAVVGGLWWWSAQQSPATAPAPGETVQTPPAEPPSEDAAPFAAAAAPELFPDEPTLRSIFGTDAGSSEFAYGIPTGAEETPLPNPELCLPLLYAAPEQPVDDGAELDFGDPVSDVLSGFLFVHPSTGLANEAFGRTEPLAAECAEYTVDEPGGGPTAYQYAEVFHQQQGGAEVIAGISTTPWGGFATVISRVGNVTTVTALGVEASTSQVIAYAEALLEVQAAALPG